jgi:hypothetical protein
MLSIVLACALVAGDSSPSAACASHVRPSPGTRLGSTAFKGVELYSWRTKSGSYRYSLLWGTNRNKRESEIKSPGCALPDVASVKKAISHLANGEWVTWLGDQAGHGSHLPPREILEDISAHCKALGITLNVAGQESQAGRRTKR